MAYKTLIVEIEEHVCLIKLHRPDALNALNMQLMGELADAIRQASENDKVRCILLTGSEKAFAAGADIKEMSEKTFVDVFGNDFFTPETEDFLRCRKPIIANVMGGFSGAAIFPVAVRMVYQVARACRIPVMGCGGVETAHDVIEMMMAGATAVQVGAANLRNPYACKEIVEALPCEMERLGIERLSDIIGIVK